MIFKYSAQSINNITFNFVFIIKLHGKFAIN